MSKNYLNKIITDFLIKYILIGVSWESETFFPNTQPKITKIQNWVNQKEFGKRK